MGFERACQPEIIRTVQKDTFYVNSLRESILELLNNFTNNAQQRWRLHHQISGLVAPLLYFGFHSLNQLQTLGEEYTGTIQMNRNMSGLPNRALQLFNYIMEFGGDIMTERALKNIQTSINGNEEIRDEAKEKMVHLITQFKKSIPYLKVAHLGLFYWSGYKYQISKRLTGLNYILYSKLDRPNGFLKSYKYLSIITFLQLFAVLIRQIKLYRKNNLSIVDMDDNIPGTISRYSDEKCNLCLEARKNTCTTPCGHLFCWDCILNCLQNRQECPICREEVKKQNVVFLMNYV